LLSVATSDAIVLFMFCCCEASPESSTATQRRASGASGSG
jgi:hypothetical protein